MPFTSRLCLRNCPGLLALLVAPLLLAIPVLQLPAQAKPSVAGDYAGVLGPLHLKLHIRAEANGSLSGALDSPDQGAVGIPCADFKLDGQSLTFTVPSVNGSWKGTVSADGNALTGTGNQGADMPLDFTRDTFVAAARPSPRDGMWLGSIDAKGTKLRLQLIVKSDSSGREFCTADSPDQNAFGFACGKVEWKDNNFSFDLPSVHGEWSGKLAADGQSMSGTWQQGDATPLNFLRQLTAIVQKPPAPPKFDAAMPPVAAADLESVLAKDLAKALESGELAPSTGAGVSIGVVQHGSRHVFTFGAAKTDSVFEIGSITKTFTGLILAQMVEQGKVKFDDPVRELLPANTVSKPAGAEITLLSLATH